jgi:hypothetical protein
LSGAVHEARYLIDAGGGFAARVLRLRFASDASAGVASAALGASEMAPTEELSTSKGFRGLTVVIFRPHARANVSAAALRFSSAASGAGANITVNPSSFDNSVVMKERKSIFSTAEKVRNRSQALETLSIFSVVSRRCEQTRVRGVLL